MPTVKQCKGRLTGSEFHSRRESGFERPCSGNVSDRVSSTTEDEERETERLDELHTVGVSCIDERVSNSCSKGGCSKGELASHRQVEGTETISRKGISSALQHDRRWSVPVHDLLNDLFVANGVSTRALKMATRKCKTDGFKDALVRFVRDTVPQWEVDRVVPALSEPNVLDVSGSREELSVFVERASHDSIGRVERFFDSVSVVHVDIDVEDSRMVAQQFKDTENDIWTSNRSDRGRFPSLTRVAVRTVDVAETTRFGFLRVVESSCPIDRNVTLVSGQTSRSLWKTPVEKVWSALRGFRRDDEPNSAHPSNLPPRLSSIRTDRRRLDNRLRR